ncbi:MAG: hypothetical protein IT459_22750 [Planctomycetes bacterium]|nr:hypothetical protein [Planctomycetota bacterium]
MLYSKRDDGYFQSIEEAEDALGEGETLDDLMLVICTPNRARPLELDYFCDELAEDDDGPPELQEAIDAFNAIIDRAPPLSWSPGKCALDVAPDALAGPSWPSPTRGETSAENLQLSGGPDA